VKIEEKSWRQSWEQVKNKVVLEEAKIKEAPKLECPPTPTPSVEDIEKRLKEAADRRKSMEASTLEKLAQEEKKREEVRAKKASVCEPEEKEEEGEKEAAWALKPSKKLSDFRRIRCN